MRSAPWLKTWSLGEIAGSWKVSLAIGRWAIGGGWGRTRLRARRAFSSCGGGTRLILNGSNMIFLLGLAIKWTRGCEWLSPARSPWVSKRWLISIVGVWWG